MTISTLNGRLGFLTMVAVAALLFLNATPSAVMAGGEPGSGCGLEGLKYDPGPYIGDVTLKWQTNGVYAYGIVVRAGDPDCDGTIAGLINPSVTEDEFKNWKSKDLRLACIENLCSYDLDTSDEVTCPFTCHEDGAYFEVVGVGGMKWDSATSFTAKFVIMHLE